jgi:hypothetical protein
LPESSVPGDEALQELFAEIAAEYARPVKNFVFRLQRGLADKDWIRFCQPVLRSIQSAAKTMDLGETAKRIAEFDEALSRAEGKANRWLTGETRDRLAASYHVLARALPRTFQLDEKTPEWEKLSLVALLRQTSGVGSTSLKKLDRSGLSSMYSMLTINKEQLALAASVPIRVADRICKSVLQYREELAALPPEFTESGLRSQLSDLVKELRRARSRTVHHSTEKRPRGSLWEEKAPQITLLLVELGEVELFDSLKKLSVKKRLEKLEEYLSKDGKR